MTEDVMVVMVRTGTEREREREREAGQGFRMIRGLRNGVFCPHTP